MLQVVVNTHRVPSIDVLLDVISSRIGLINGAKKLYTTGGTLIKDINKIKDGEVCSEIWIQKETVCF